MGHGREIGGDDAAVDVFAHRQSEFRFRADKLGGLYNFAQPYGLALVVRHLNADGRLARHTLDQNALRAHGQAQIVGQAGNAAVLHARFRLELVRRHYRSGIDLGYGAVYVKFRALFREHLGKDLDRKSTRLNSSHQIISYAVFCLKKKTSTVRKTFTTTTIRYFVHSFVPSTPPNLPLP